MGSVVLESMETEVSSLLISRRRWFFLNFKPAACFCADDVSFGGRQLAALNERQATLESTFSCSGV